MEKAIQDVVRNAVRYSWTVVNGQKRSLDREIERDLVGEMGLDPVFKRKPKGEAILQWAALPTLISIKRTKDPERKRKDHWAEIPRSDRQRILSFYGLKDGHCTITHFANNTSQVKQIASYMAATFAFTTEKCPEVIPMKKLMDDLFRDFREDTLQMEYHRQMGLMIITDVLGSYPGETKMSGLIRSFIRWRLDEGKVTVFLDAGPASLVDLLKSGETLERKDVENAISETAVGAHKDVAALFYESDCYINFNLSTPLRGINELSEMFSI
jgi:hypothetical protein